MDKLLDRFVRMGAFFQICLAFLVLAIFSTAAGGYATLDPTAKSFALHYVPLLLLAAVFVGFFRLFSRLQR